MKTYIIKSTQSITGYALVEKDENGAIIQRVELNKTHTHSKTGIVTIDLPKNASNRLCINPSKLEKVMADCEEYEMPYKDESEKRTFGNGKKVEDYLTEEEKAIIEEIMAKAKARKEADKPAPLTEREKLEREIEKLTKKLNKMNEEDVEA